MQLGTSAGRTLVTSLSCLVHYTFIPHHKASWLVHYITTIHLVIIPFQSLLFIYHMIFRSSACSAPFPFCHSFCFTHYSSRTVKVFPPSRPYFVIYHFCLFFCVSINIIFLFTFLCLYLYLSYFINSILNFLFSFILHFTPLFLLHILYFIQKIYPQIFAKQ